MGYGGSREMHDDGGILPAVESYGEVGGGVETEGGLKGGECFAERREGFGVGGEALMEIESGLMGLMVVCGDQLGVAMVIRGGGHHDRWKGRGI